MTTNLIGKAGVCRNCDRREFVYRASRFGGGNYRVAGRMYRSSICVPCAKTLMDPEPHKGQRKVGGWSISDLRRVLADAAKDEAL